MSQVPEPTEPLRSLEFTAVGTRTASGPLTWGQQAIWAAIERTRPEDQYFNYARVLDLPALGGPDEDALLAALAAVVGRHESLRTRLRSGTGPGERPVQQVHREARFTVAVHEAIGAAEATGAAGASEAELDAAAERLAGELAGRVFDYVAEWPLRVAVVSGGGRPRRLVLGFCHLAADGGGADVVERDLAQLLAEPAAEPGADPATVLGPAPAPLDLALDQASPAGHQRNAAAMAWWDEQLRRIPVSMFRTRVAEPAEPRWWTGRIGSPALGPATARLARASRTGGTAVLMAAITRLVAARSGDELCAVLPIVSNRFPAERRELVSSLSLEGLLVAPVDPAADFLDHLRATWAASLKGYQHAEYDDRARDLVFAKASADRGETIHPYCCFNDLRTLPDPAALRRGAGTPEGALPDGPAVFDWSRKPEKVSCRFCVHVVGGPEDFTVELTADTAYLPPAAIESFLRELEALIVGEAGKLSA